ncbi:MAG: SDR family oxidoreductase [Acidimicrobiales bacterium]
MAEAGSTLDAVTGAFSYSGRAIARELLERGHSLRTLTGHPERATAASGDIEVAPLDFAHPAVLARSLEGVTTLYNTYWVRFARGSVTHDSATANSRVLFAAARSAGVERIVHVSITHPSTDSPFAYFRGKAVVEQALSESGLQFAILRPAILFGGDGVLVNNIAWLLRHLPVFGIAGDGNYRLRPVHVDDLARLAADCGSPPTDRSLASGSVVDAVGPDRPTFNELVEWIRGATGARSRIVHAPAALLPPLSRLLGLALRDVLLTGDELRSMMSGLADTDGPATGTISIKAWLAEDGKDLGLSYANEVSRHFASRR